MPPNCTNCTWCQDHTLPHNEHVLEYIPGCWTHPRPWPPPTCGYCSIDPTGKWNHDPNCPIHN